MTVSDFPNLYSLDEFIENIGEILRDAVNMCIMYGKTCVDVDLNYKIRLKPLVLRIVLTCKSAGMLKIVNYWFSIYTKTSFIPIREGKEPKSRPEISLSFKELIDLREMRKLLEYIENLGLVEKIVDTIEKIYENMFPEFEL